MISGFPQEASTYIVRFKVTDKLGRVAKRNLSITIGPQPVTEEQAIKIASGNLPAEVVGRSKIHLEYQPSYIQGEEGEWYVHFDNANVTHNELHWSAEQSTVIGPEDVLKLIVITINGETGEVIGRMATNNTFFSPPGPPNRCGCDSSSAETD